MAAKKKAKKKAAKPRARSRPVPKYKCPGYIPAPTAPCKNAELPHNLPQLCAELEAYFKCLCAWQQAVERVVNACCANGPENVPPPPPPPF